MAGDVDKVQGGLTEAQKRANVIRMAFGGSEERFATFLRVIREEIPEGTGVVLRGSAVTGQRWRDGAAFDADGPGTSDLDLTLVGDDAIGLFKMHGFFVPGMHSRPVSDQDLDIAPGLIPLRETLMVMTGRPVNIQASRDVVMHVRGDLLDQLYLTLIETAIGGAGREAKLAAVIKHTSPDLVVFQEASKPAIIQALFLPTGYLSRVRACDVLTDPATCDASDHFPLAAELDV